jgi:hypothetical protein
MPEVEKIQSLNLPDPQGPFQACSGKTLPLPVIDEKIILKVINVNEKKAWFCVWLVTIWYSFTFLGIWQRNLCLQNT